MSPKKKSAKIISLPQTPENQIRTRARNLKIGKCYITRNWESMREGNILITRLHQQGGITIGVYLVDLALFGVKESFYRFNMPSYEYRDFWEDYFDPESAVEIDYTMAHNIIYGALEYGETYGFKPDKDFAVARYVLEEDTEDIPLIEVEYGLNGMPTVFFTKENPRHAEIRQLEKMVGKGNYQIIEQASGPVDLSPEPDDDEFLDDFDDEEDFEDEEDFDDEEDFEDYIDPEVVESYLAGVDWRSIYRKCDAIFNLKPWKKLRESDIFAVRLPGSKKEVFVSVMGFAKNKVAIGFFLGGRAIQKFLNFIHPDVHSDPSGIFAIPHIFLSWENHSDLEENQYAIMLKLGIEYPGKQSWPQFLTSQIGFASYIPDIKEFKTIDLLLDQCLEIFPRALKDSSLLWDGQDETSATFLFRIPQKSINGLQWKEEFLVPAEDPAIRKLGFNLGMLNQYKSLPVIWKSLQLELFLIPLPVPSGNGKLKFPFVLIALDPEKNLIIITKILNVSKRYETQLGNLPNILLEEFIQKGGRPELIEFRNPDLHLHMGFMADKAGTNVKYKLDLQLLDQAFSEFADNLFKKMKPEIPVDRDET